MAERGRRDWLSEPIAAYEMHLGSWRVTRIARKAATRDSAAAG